MTLQDIAAQTARGVQRTGTFRMKRVLMGLASIVCAALGLSPQLVGAVTPSQVTAANRLYISGSTATDNALVTLLIRTGNSFSAPLCKSGTIDIYIDNSASLPAAHQKAVLCQLNFNVGAIPSNSTVAIMKESNGGSQEGTTPIADGTTRTFLNVTSDSAISCTTTTAVAAGTLNSFPNHQAFTLHSVCSGIDASVHPDVGIADVNPALFVSGLTPISQAEINRLQSDGLYEPMFGIGVSLNLYRVLQSAQGKITTSDSAADMPSLTMAELRAVLSGVFSNWDQIKGPSGVSLPSKTIYVCREGDTSGGQAVIESYFFNQRCANGVQGVISSNNVSCQQHGCPWNQTTFATDAVFAGRSTADARACLDARNDHDLFAIGPLSSESRYDALGNAGGAANAAAGTQQFRFVKIDGRTPNLESVANGLYDMVVENVMNRLNTTFNGQSPPAGNKASLANYIRDSFSNQDVVSTLIVHHPHGLGGGLLPALGNGVTPQSSLPASASQVEANPVSAYTLSLNGPVQDCGSRVIVWPSVAPFTHTRWPTDDAAGEQ
jgi:ABC-type phosphate transport system substrate-binding protein